jgi:CysZ protein
MLTAAVTALSDILSPAFRAVLWKSLGLTLALIIVAWFGLDAAVRALLPTLGPPWDGLASWLTGLTLFIGLGFLVAPVTALSAGLFLDDVAAAVETTHYPDDPPGRPMPFWPGLRSALRFAALVALVNLALLLLVLLPGVNLPLFFVANAYFVGREYFEFIAGRHLPPDAVRRERQAGSARLFVAGLLIAAIMAVPVINLLTPLYATAFIAHLFKRRAYRAA